MHVRIKMPATVCTVLDSLHAAGYEAYAVGGCVRDSVLGRKPQDWDITTSARPEQVKEIFDRTIDTGIQHGTVTVMIRGNQHEVTTYRMDGEYTDCRHPEEVTFTSSLAEDLKRRDFTINAMAYNDREGLVDLYGGVEDLQRHVIRCVGDPMERFGEDALRIMRAVRFSAQLDFGIDEKTLEAVRTLAPNLSKISAERICMELTKLIVSDHPEYLRLAYETGITKIILPEFDAMMETEQNNPHHMYNVGDHTLAAMKAVKADRILRLALLLHDIAKPVCKTTDEEGVDHFCGHGNAGAEMAVRIMRRLKMDNDTIRRVKTLVTYHDWRPEPSDKLVRRMINKVGEELFPLLICMQEADTRAQSEWQRDEKLRKIAQIKSIGERIFAEGQCVNLKSLAIGGGDLLQMGVEKGPEIGRLLHLALEEVLEEPAHNEKAYLTAFVQKELGSKEAKFLDKGMRVEYK